MPLFQFFNPVSGLREIRDVELPFDATTLGLTSGSLELREVSPPAASPVIIPEPEPTTGPIIQYDFLSANPETNLGSLGTSNDLIRAVANVNQTRGLIVTRNQSFTADTQYALPLGTSFTWHLKLLFRDYSVTAGYNLLSTTHSTGENANGIWANYMDDNTVYLFPKLSDAPYPPIGFTPAPNTMNICSLDDLASRNPNADVKEFAFFERVLTDQEVADFIAN